MPTVGAAFYEPEGDVYLSSELTRGPWDSGAQHAGPPAALIAREIERLPAEGPARAVGRITYEILRPVPIAALRVSARVVRPGRSVELVEAVLADERGPVIRANGWRLVTSEPDVPAELGSAGGPLEDPSPWLLAPGARPVGPEHGREVEFFPTGEAVGMQTAMEYRFVRGSYLEPGPATVWMRMRQPLVAGEEPTPLQRAAVAADFGNGISATLDFERFVFINVDLTLHVVRPPAGEWIGVDSVTLPERRGLGLADTALFDVRGPVARAGQTLLVAERARP
jgi:acyl-Coa thioesterase superfamily protein/acyl-CoA thioesterase superfamily protein